MDPKNQLGSVLLVFLIFCISESHAGEFCNKYRGYYHHSTTTYCTYGCCGSAWDEYCCDASVGLVVGCVVAGIIGFSILVALVCCCIKKQSHSGRVVQPATGVRPGASHVTVVYAGASSQHPYGMGMAQPMQPPAYKQFENPPPAYNYSDPAYPPTAPPTAPANPQATYPPPPPPPPSASSQPPPPGFSVNDGPTSTGSVAPPSTGLRQ